MARASMGELRTHILYIRKAIERIEKHAEEMNGDVTKIKSDCVALKTQMKNHLAHHEAQAKQSKWFWGFVVGVVGIVTAIVNILLKFLLV